jgi:hypothetical protein
MLMIGSPGAGKSMLAARLPSILPPLSPSELLEVSMIASVAGEIRDGALTARRPFRAPHHSSTSCRSSIRACWIRCASPWRSARSRCRAPITTSPIRRASYWSRR